MLKRTLAILVSALMVGTLFVGCQSSKGSSTSSAASGSSAAAGKKYTIAVIPKLVGVPYFNSCQEGLKKAATDTGNNIVYTGPTTADAAAQVNIIQDEISKGVDALCVAANDPSSVAPVLTQAKSKGILVMDFDTPVDTSLVTYSIHQIDDTEFGQHMWDQLVKGMGSTGDYAIITGGLSAANLNSWIDAGTKYAATKYPGLHLVTPKVASDEQQQKAMQAALDLIKAYPNLKGIVGVSTPAPIGAAQAVQQKGLQGKVFVVGSAMPQDSKPFLKDGSLYESCLWDPSKLGYLTAYVASQKLAGKAITDGLEVPNVGKITLKSDGKTVVMGPPADYTKDNIDSINY